MPAPTPERLRALLLSIPGWAAGFDAAYQTLHSQSRRLLRQQPAIDREEDPSDV
jgi:hypothetical protein